ncbi:TetR/AcrR family transcriptional regulator [Pararhizobium antarcticum]|uniref:TetR family transcriptional regulator n=1 Tax=Pararhizobium antarcticum TaxID=1798805 RepID=A0A657LYC4_9HYPH|nr:TetR/AcrR family transcriptional regulator [Pararhizobium antarcticum]OJF96576.1 TetR family transcriptional regulator [Rhizobium sp. 58]OJG01419.1 TetR family transcriptional regulator [Pararhizobium antarcticum]
MSAAENDAHEHLTQDDRPDDRSAVGRKAAGEDPAKREQIIDGAKRVFMSVGFDAASMNDITREAGVSKGTIYVYFQNKEDLFVALIEQERNRVVRSIKHALDDHEPIDEALFEFGRTLTSHITSDDTIRAMRMVLGVSDRMPTLAKRFFAAAPENGYTVLKAYLERQVQQARIEIEDTDLATRQFIEICMAGMLKRRLFGEMEAPPALAYIEKAVASGVKIFLLAYGGEPAAMSI